MMMRSNDNVTSSVWYLYPDVYLPRSIYKVIYLYINVKRNRSVDTHSSPNKTPSWKLKIDITWQKWKRTAVQTIWKSATFLSRSESLGQSQSLLRLSMFSAVVGICLWCVNLTSWVVDTWLLSLCPPLHRVWEGGPKIMEGRRKGFLTLPTSPLICKMSHECRFRCVTKGVCGIVWF